VLIQGPEPTHPPRDGTGSVLQALAFHLDQGLQPRPTEIPEVGLLPRLCGSKRLGTRAFWLSEVGNQVHGVALVPMQRLKTARRGAAN
jgi:hypothetical protein